MRPKAESDQLLLKPFFKNLENLHATLENEKTSPCCTRPPANAVQSVL